MAKNTKSIAKVVSAAVKEKDNIRKRYELGVLTGRRDGIKLVALICEGYILFLILTTIVIWVIFGSILALYLAVAAPSLIILLAAVAMELTISKKNKAINSLKRELERHSL